MKQEFTLVKGAMVQQLVIIAHDSGEVWLGNVYSTFNTGIEAQTFGARLLTQHINEGYQVTVSATTVRGKCDLLSPPPHPYLAL